jgi:DNA-binding ferritin-like protein (Dps family)
MILLTDQNGNTKKYKSITQAANMLGVNYKSVYQSVELGYWTKHRETKIKYKATHETI